MLDIEFAEASDCGPVREHNEDFVGHSRPSTPEQLRSRGWLFTLADGVGGQERGEVASRLTVETMIAEYARAVTGENTAAMLSRAVQSANTQVYQAGHGEMASTLVACTIRFDRATIAHVGDSRCYLVRRGQLQLLTRDHTVVNDQLRLGFMSAQDAKRAVNRNVLSRSVGTNLFVSPDVNEHTVQPGDMLLLCSDGLHGAVPDREIARVIGACKDLEQGANELISIANQRDGGDNVSVQLIRIHSVDAVGMYRGRPYRLN
jgi:PPM family protein phosphatase